MPFGKPKDPAVSPATLKADAYLQDLLPAPPIPWGDIESVCLKYMGTKKRWRTNPHNTEPDYLCVQRVLTWIAEAKDHGSH